MIVPSETMAGPLVREAAPLCTSLKNAWAERTRIESALSARLAVRPFLRRLLGSIRIRSFRQQVVAPRGRVSSERLDRVVRHLRLIDVSTSRRQDIVVLGKAKSLLVAQTAQHSGASGPM